MPPDKSEVMVCKPCKIFVSQVFRHRSTLHESPAQFNTLGNVKPLDFIEDFHSAIDFKAHSQNLTRAFREPRLLLNHTGFCFCDLAVDELVGQEPLLIQAFELLQIQLDR